MLSSTQIEQAQLQIDISSETFDELEQIDAKQVATAQANKTHAALVKINKMLPYSVDGESEANAQHLGEGLAAANWLCSMPANGALKLLSLAGALGGGGGVWCVGEFSFYKEYEDSEFLSYEVD